MRNVSVLAVIVIAGVLGATDLRAQTPVGPPVQVPGTSVYVRAFKFQGDWLSAFNKAGSVPSITINGKTLRPRLAEPKSFAINNTIKSTYGATLFNYWLGGLRERSSSYRPWYWATSGTQFDYTDWGSGEPNNTAGKEDRLIYWSVKGSIKWADISQNNIGSGFIVEYR